MKSIKWPALVALILLPLLAVAALIGLSSRSNEAVSAAVVNLDEAVKVNGQLVPMGRQLAAAMVDRDGDNVSWTLADAASADAGLRSGAYSVVVTIPKEFSTSATSFSANDAAKAQQATIDVVVSDNSPVTDSQMAAQVARLATDTINSTLTSGYLDGIYVGFNTVGEQFTSIVDGVNQLHDGSSQLADGAIKASQGGNQLASGLGQLRDNAGKLNDGGDQLVSGAEKLSAGADQLNVGVSQLADQIPAYADGAAQAIGGVGALSDGLTQVIDGLDQSAGSDSSQLDQLVTGALGISTGIDSVDSAMQGLANPSAPLPDGVSDQVKDGAAAAGLSCSSLNLDQAACDAFQMGLDVGIQGGFKAGAGAASQALNDTSRGASLKDGAAKVAAGVDQLATELPKQTEQQLGQLKAGLTQIRDGADELATKAKPIVDNAPVLGAGVKKLADGTSELAAGVDTFAAGTGTYAAGVKQYTAGVSQAADGADTFAAGLISLSNGVTKLDGGIATFAKKMAEGADQVPSYSQSDRETLSSVISDPVVRADTLISAPQIPIVSLLLVAALWLGALASFVAVRPIPRDVVTSRASTIALWARTMWLPVVVVAGQGIVLGAVGAAVLKVSVGTGIGLAALLAVAGVSFVFANHFLASWWGNVGRAISALLMLVTVGLALSSDAGILAPVGIVSPLQNAFELVRANLAQGSGMVELAGAAILMGAISAVLSIMSIGQRRRLTAKKFAQATA